MSPRRAARAQDSQARGGCRTKEMAMQVDQTGLTISLGPGFSWDSGKISTALASFASERSRQVEGRHG